MSRRDLAPAPSKAIAGLKPYETVKQQALFLEDESAASKLDWNESTQKPSQVVTDAVIESIHKGSLQWYPDVNSFALISDLAKYCSLPEEYIQTFPGSDASLEYACRTFLDHGDQVLMAGPTYDNFRIYAESCGAAVNTHLGPSPFEPDAQGLINSITEKTKIVYIVSPNNPTGTVYSERDVKSIAEAAPESLVILDEAYYEFCGLTHAALVRDYPNLLISRSFSKAFGLAALRCGYVLTDPQNIGFLNRIRVGKNLSVPAQAGAIAALADFQTIEEYVQTVRANMDIVALMLGSLGIEVVTTPANFIMVKVNRPEEVIRYLNASNIYVRNRSAMPQLAGFIRITIGDDTATERVCKAFRDMPAEYYLRANEEHIPSVTLRRGAKLTLKRGAEMQNDETVSEGFERIQASELVNDRMSTRKEKAKSD
jgi:histidinol-phosphate aminotransferase